MLDNLMTSEEFDKTISSNADLKASKPKFKPSQNKKEVAKKQNNANKGGKGNNAKSQSKNPRPQPKHVEVEKQDVVYSTEDDHTEKQAKPRANNLKVMFLGGIGEIGKNMTVLEYGKDIIVIDCGVMFPSVDMLGIDLVVPDVTYLVENKDRVRGFLITHGHEDHIGSVPYVIGEVPAPIYASKMTCGLIKKKMEEHKKIEYKAVAVKPKQKVKLGCFEIEFIHVNHAIPGAFALAIKTPVGMVVHTGDYKIDLTPIYDEKFDFQSFASLGEQGVLLYMSDSTNAEREGYSLSERVVGETLERLFVENKDRRMIVAAFASNVDRMQEVMNLAEKYKRKVVLTGRSMVNVTDVATQIGEMKINKDNIIEVEKMKNFKDSELCILSTGSQGEPNSALSRMAAGEFKGIEIGNNDTVIFSSSPIPGNEKSINNIINRLIMLGAKVIYSQLEQVHASGHACKEEMKLMLNLVKPKFFIPVHGEQKHLLAQRETAVSVGMDRHNVLLPMLGMCVEVNKNFMRATGTVPFGSRLIDGAGIGEMESNVLKERKQLSEDGLCIVILNVNSQKGELNSRPEIVSRGFTYSGEAQTWLEDARNAIINSLDQEALRSRDYINVKLALKKALTNYLNKKLKRKPLIVPIIIESNN
ncbi:MAG: ribonuclease J [Clostridia bacterium]|nr:ribonuclease J [Clostridia bacterium]